MRRFSVVMRGYSRREVDDLFARIDATLGRGTHSVLPATAAEVQVAGFPVVMRGYAPREVDEELANVMLELEARRA
jgi:DivIVA domain-containing protein